MGISRLDAILIKEGNDDEIRVQAGGPCKKTGKWVMWIMFYPNGEYHRPIVNTNPIYDTEDAALEAGRALVAEIRGMDVLA